MSLNIFFVGTVSTGKTTLLREIEKELNQLRISYTSSSNVVRNLIKENVIEKEVDVSATNRNQIVITAEYMCQYWENLQNSSLFLSDRSPIDLIAYSRVRKDASEYSITLAERTLKNVFSFKDANFLVFYFPPVLPFEQDEVRNKGGRMKIDREIKKILKEFNIPFIKVKEIDLQKRVDFLKNIIVKKLI